MPQDRRPAAQPSDAEHDTETSIDATTLSIRQLIDAEAAASGAPLRGNSAAPLRDTSEAPLRGDTTAPLRGDPTQPPTDETISDLIRTATADLPPQKPDRPQDHPIEHRLADTPAQPRPRRRARITATLARHTRQAAAATGRATWRFLRRDDTPRNMAIALLVVMILLRPGVVASLALLTALIALTSYLTLGHDRSAEILAERFDRLRQRDPQAAERLRARAIRATAMADRLAARLPERWTTGLYLPDFARSAPLPEKMKTDPFDRLAALRDTDPTAPQ